MRRAKLVELGVEFALERQLLDDGFENATWNTNWTGAWFKSTFHLNGLYAAGADVINDGTFDSIPLDASDAIALNVNFQVNKDDTENIARIVG